MQSDPWDIPINPNRIDSDALSLLAWANADGTRRVSDLDAARSIIQARGRRLNPDLVPGLNQLEANDAVVRGRFDSPHLQSYQNAFVDFYGLNGGTAGANAAKIETTLAGMQTQPQQANSGGVGLSPLDAGMMAADLAANTLPLTQGPVAAPDVAQAAVGRTAASRLGSIDLDAPGQAAYPGPSEVGSVNLSGGGPGTSTTKGNATIARQAAKRAGGGQGVLGAADAALGAVDLGIGEMSSRGLKSAGVMARNAGMKNLSRGLMRAGGAARVLAPAAAIGGAALPAVFGAMDGYEQAGAGGAVIQGGAGAAGALAGGAIGSAILPGIGTVIGAGIGSMLGSGAGSGLTGLAQGMVEKAQQGDTGFMGSIGAALDPLIDTAYEKEQKAVQQQLNSPAMQAVKQQERARQERARADQMEALLMQSYLR